MIGRKLLLAAMWRTVLVAGLGYDAIGRLTPASELGVQCSYSNINEVADYTFSFLPDTALPAGGLLVITFPQQYEAGLGGSGNCGADSCTVSGRSVTVTVGADLQAGQKHSVTVFGVRNPAFVGGTGPFALTSYYGSTILDQNLVFGVLGIAAAVSNLSFASVITTSGSSARVGDASRLDFFFKTALGLPANIWIRFTFPSNPSFSLAPQPTCISIAARGVTLQGSLQCVLSSNQVTLTGVTAALPPGSDGTIRISVTNPPQAGLAGPFTVETGVFGTNTVLERAANVPGIQIAPGQVTGIAIIPADSQMTQSTGRLMPYLVTFTLTNPVPSGGGINIRFSADFNPNGSLNGAYVVSGLSDATSALQLAYTAATFTLSISSFAAYTTKTAIQLWIPLLNPTIAGVTWPLVISSTMADGTLIDQDAQMAVTTISAVSAMTLVAGTGSYVAAQALSLQVKITPNQAIPALGYVKIRLPEGFSVTTSLPTCTCTPYGIGTTTANSCVYSNGIVTVQLFAVGTLAPIGPGDFPAGQQSSLTISTGITASQTAGMYYLDVTSYDVSSNRLETGSLVVTLTAAAFASISVDSVHREPDIPTVLKWLFTPSIDIPASLSSQNSPGYIEVILPTMTTVGGFNLFRTDLGLGIAVGGVVPCLGIAGIQPPTGTLLKCLLTQQPASAGVGNYVYVTISNFQAVAAGTVVGLHLSGLKHVQTANNPTVTFTAYKIASRVRTDINTWTGTLTTAPALTSAAQTDAVNTFASTQQGISTAFGLTFNINPPLAISATNTAFLLRITPTHDTGYCLAVVANQFTCSVTGTLYSCTCYPNSDLVYIAVGARAFVAGTNYQVIINNLVNPGSVAASNDGLVVYTIDNLTLKNSVTYSNPLPAQTAGLMVKTAATPSIYGTGYVGVTYEFIVQPTHAVPQGGSLVVTLPAIYSLTSSVPQPKCTPLGLTAVTGLSIGCAVGTTSLTVTNFVSLSLETHTTIRLTGVKNPISAGSSGLFYFTTKTAAGLVIDYDSYAGFSFTSAFVTGAASPNVYMFPTNAGLYAEYVVSLSPSATIPPGGTISVTFPTQFGSIPPPFDCRVSAPFTSLQSCALSGSTFTVTLDQSLAGTGIVLSFFGVVNPGIGSTGSFVTKCEYDGVVLDQSSTSALNAVVTTAVAPSLMVSSIGFSPQNEGEPATYTFSFTPSISFPSTSYLLISFPPEYDSHIGDSLACSATGLTGSLVCSATSDRQVRVSGFQGFSTCGSCSIVLTIEGVKNPQWATATGFFGVGIWSGSAYLEYNRAVGPLEIIEAPKLMNLRFFNVSNVYSRYVSTMFFNLTTTQSLPSTTSQGSISVLFPSHYLLTNSVLQCNSTTYATALNCTVSRDTVRISGQDRELTGEISLEMKDVPNPMQEGIADSVVVKTVDEYRKKVLDRTYANLHPAQVAYSFAGPLIKVNGDLPISVYSGTYTLPIAITVDFPCALNLTFTPTLPDFIVTPSEIRLEVGQLQTTFTLAAPISITALSSIMLWTTSGDVSPAYYTPLQKTQVLLLTPTQASIICATPPSIPIGGHSLPFLISLSFAPVNDVTVEMSLSASLNGASLAASSVSFTAGEREKYGQIVVVAGGLPASGTLELAIGGTDAGLYSLTTASVPITVVAASSSLPSISTLSVLFYSKTTALVSVTTNSPGTLYYMHAYSGTATPPFIEVRYGGPPPYDRTRSLYGELHIGTANYGTFHLGYLRAERKYTLFAYFVDLMDQQTQECKEISLYTSKLHPAFSFSLQFQQAFLNDFEVERTINAVSLLTATASWQLATLFLNSTVGSQSLSTVLTLALTDSPFNDNYPSPADLVVRLQGKMTTLAGRVNNLDVNFAISGVEVKVEDCGFLTGPDKVAIRSKQDQSLGFSASLKAKGTLYAVCVLTTVTSGSPLNWQISEGLSPANVPVAFASQAVGVGEVWNFTFTNLLPESPYVLYVTCGNDHPAVPALPSEATLVGLALKTAKTPAPKILSLNTAIGLGIGLLLLLI